MFMKLLSLQTKENLLEPQIHTLVHKKKVRLKRNRLENNNYARKDLAPSLHQPIVLPPHGVGNADWW